MSMTPEADRRDFVRRNFKGCCPFCGGESGLYLRIYVSGHTSDKLDWDGSIANWHIHDPLKYEPVRKWYRCIDCDKNIMRIND